jgi:hypothetical protein
LGRAKDLQHFWERQYMNGSRDAVQSLGTENFEREGPVMAVNHLHSGVPLAIKSIEHALVIKKYEGQLAIKTAQSTAMI